MAEVRVDINNVQVPVEARVGDTLVVYLPENPTTGYRWHASAGPQLVPSADQFTPQRDAAVGGGGIRTLRFTVVSAGSGKIELQLRRQWEVGAPQQSISIAYGANDR